MSELNGLIREAITNGDYTDPTEVAHAVAANIPGNKLRRMMADAIVDNCRIALMARRNQLLASASRSNNGGGGYSHRQARSRDWWADFCSASAHVGDGQYKALGDYTINDLEYLISEREENIERIRVHINQYQGLIHVMKVRGVDCVRELTSEDAAEAVASS